MRNLPFINIILRLCSLLFKKKNTTSVSTYNARFPFCSFIQWDKDGLKTKTKTKTKHFICAVAMHFKLVKNFRIRTKKNSH